MDNATTKAMQMKTTEYRIDALIVRTAIFMAGKVQAMATAKARADGFGREIFGFMKTIDFSKK
jgi:thiazole synthase ThiGH ThiG subunit